MTPLMFRKLYSPYKLYTVKYKTKSGIILEGILNSDIIYSPGSDIPCIMVEQVTNKIPLARVMSIYPLDKIKTKVDVPLVQPFISDSLLYDSTNRVYTISGITISDKISASILELSNDTVLTGKGFKTDDPLQSFIFKALVVIGSPSISYYIKIMSGVYDTEIVASKSYNHHNLLACVANCVNNIS